MTTIPKTSAQAFTQQPTRRRRVLNTTLLELVWAVSDVVQDDKIVALTVADIVNSGNARLTGTFKGARMIII